MNLVDIFQQFPDQQSCIDHLEHLRWGHEGKAHCPHCGSTHVAKKADSGRIGRWNCHDCKSSFNVLSGTIFEKTKVPLQKWFLAIGLIINAKKSMSSYQLARDLELNQKTAWYMEQRIRAEMATKQSEIRLQGIIEADETYVGGKPRKKNKKSDRHDDDNTSGRGTKKIPVIGAVARGGKVVTKMVENVKSRTILDFISKVVEPDGSVLITDEWRGYKESGKLMPHKVIKHFEEYVKDNLHTNTIEGFWALVKRSRFGSHHHYKKKFMPLYLGETAWKYNQRDNENAFDTFMQGCFT